MTEPGEKAADTALYITSEIVIRNALFRIVFIREWDEKTKQTKNVIKGIWGNERSRQADLLIRNQEQLHFELQDMADYFHIKLPDFLDLKFEIDRIILTYETINKSIACDITVNGYKQLKLGMQTQEHVQIYYISYESDYIYEFKKLPVLGGMLSGNDGVGLKKLQFEYTGKSSSEIELEFMLRINHNITTLPFQFHTGKKNKELLSDLDGSAGDVKWLDINKTFRNISFRRIGVQLNKTGVTLYFTAGFTIAVLSLDFYDLYLSLPLLQSGSVSFGLKGLAITLNKPPFMVSGGLYKVTDTKKYGVGELYNGEVMLKISKFSFTALASYGKMNDGDITFFLFLMLSASIGGPPYFFVNGLALGFGINRSLKLPELKNVTKFPFVAAVLSSDTTISKNSSPQQALTALSDWVKPCRGDYFLAAGIKFLSFGMIQSFVLMLAEFGNRLRISLLGYASLSIPPNIKEKVSPIAYAQLALEAEYDPEAGEIKVLGTLTPESYVIDKKCKLSGGFGFCVWYSGDYKGDFLVTIGGCHHPAFKNIHYPELDRVRINWQIMKGLNLSGSAYFALTPSCVMAGAELELSYESGNLKAWLKGSLSFYMSWKPFHYEMALYVSLGASYTLKIWKFHKTFSLEVGAGLSVWGPDFAGKVTIHWYIISFTIHFGSRKQEVKKIDWREFADSFLAKSENVTNSNNKSGSGMADRSIPRCTITVSDGIKRRLTLTDGSIINIVNAERLLINGRGAMPCTRLVFNHKDQDTYDKNLGIVPMGVKQYKSCLTVEFIPVTGNLSGEVCFLCRTVRENIPAGLYLDKVPDMNDGLIKEVPVGMELSLQAQDTPFVLPSPQQYYEMKKLTEAEIINVGGLVWTKRSLSSVTDYSGQNPVDRIKETLPANQKREEMLSSLSSVFHTKEEVCLRDMSKEPEQYLMAGVLLASTGAVCHDEKSSMCQ